MRKAILIFLMSLICVCAVSVTFDFMEPTQTDPNSPEFIRGYNDGYNKRWAGAIYWTLSQDYRQGHMQGTYDKNKKP